MRRFLSDLTVPLIVLAGTLLFFLNVQEAPSVSRRVPYGVMIFILAMAGLVIAGATIEAFARAAAGDADAKESAQPGSSMGLQLRRVALIGLALAYVAMFGSLGFTLSNFLFLCAALPLAGFTEGRPWPAMALRVLALAAVSAAFFHLLARIMAFNVPAGPFGF